MNSTAERSKYLSYLLRHAPEKANLTLDKQGWCLIDQLLANTDFTEEELSSIVFNDTKGRYSFDAFATSIRANQGHSTDTVKLTFKKAVPPVVLYHGTHDGAVENILKVGLQPMSRHHVHLSADLDTAQNVGGRRKRGVVVFTVDTKTMLANGYDFFLSDNGVWLVNTVPPPFLKVLA
jgi:putative RNA 2'-phosphotransferase